MYIPTRSRRDSLANSHGGKGVVSIWYSITQGSSIGIRAGVYARGSINGASQGGTLPPATVGDRVNYILVYSRTTRSHDAVSGACRVVECSCLRADVDEERSRKWPERGVGEDVGDEQGQLNILLVMKMGQPMKAGARARRQAESGRRRRHLGQSSEEREIMRMEE